MKKIILASFVLYLFILPINAAADVGIDAGNRPGGNISPEERDEDVVMKEEVVTIDVINNSEGESPFTEKNNYEEDGQYLKTEAVFQMENTSNDTKFLELFFPVPCGVNVNNASVNAQELCNNRNKASNFELIINGKTKEFDLGYFELSEETVNSLNSNFLNSGSATGIFFSHEFEASNITEITVKYQQDLESVKTNYTNIMYIMETGSHWSESIGKGTIQINFPHDITPAMFLELDDRYEIKEDQLVWEFEDLEPTQDDNISVIYNQSSQDIWKNRKEELTYFNSNNNAGNFTMLENIVTEEGEIYSYPHLMQFGLFNSFNLLSQKDTPELLSDEDLNSIYNSTQDLSDFPQSIIIDKDFGWIVDFEQGTPTLEYKFDGNYQLDKLELSSVFNIPYKNENTGEFRNFNDIISSPSEIRIIFDDDSSQKYEINDARDGVSSIDLSDKTSSSIVIEVLDYYPGRYENFVGISYLDISLGEQIQKENSNQDTSEETNDEKNSNESETNTDQTEDSNNILNIILGIVGFSFVVGIVIGGFVVSQRTISKKEPNKTKSNDEKQEAKKLD